MSNSGVLDTRFRSALERMAVQGRLNAYTTAIDPYLEIAAVMKKLDGGPALLFSAVDGYDMPVIGNLLSCQANCEAAFGVDFNGIRFPAGTAHDGSFRFDTYRLTWRRRLVAASRSSCPPTRRGRLSS